MCRRPLLPCKRALPGIGATGLSLGLLSAPLFKGDQTFWERSRACISKRRPMCQGEEEQQAGPRNPCEPRIGGAHLASRMLILFSIYVLPFLGPKATPKAVYNIGWKRRSK